MGQYAYYKRNVYTIECCKNIRKTNAELLKSLNMTVFM